MPTATQHIAQAAHNEALSLAVEADYADWAVTALFYAALHYVEAYFYVHAARQHAPPHYTNHSLRGPAVRIRIPRMYRHYQRLFDRSIQARYDCVAFAQSNVQYLRQNDLEPLKQYVQQNMPPAP
jgi:hypothetical protein